MKLHSHSIFSSIIYTTCAILLTKTTAANPQDSTPTPTSYPSHLHLHPSPPTRTTTLTLTSRTTHVYTIYKQHIAAATTTTTSNPYTEDQQLPPIAPIPLGTGPFIEPGFGPEGVVGAAASTTSGSSSSSNISNSNNNSSSSNGGNNRNTNITVEVTSPSLFTPAPSPLMPTSLDHVSANNAAAMALTMVGRPDSLFLARLVGGIGIGIGIPLLSFFGLN
ncbi:MAG: hypothetical protein M1834_002750 [Cirrosporium novae-zelandiae]|nr:MAG: hypothetical protein M1834_002750 [Cirrosporium novae-zelandiae]